MQKRRFQTNSIAETYKFGELVGKCLIKGDILALKGNLGAGKTTLTHGIAQGLGIKTHISSPTFTLLFEHPAGTRNIPLYHFDAYRLEDKMEWYDAGFMEYLDGQGVTVIEWADKLEDILPKETIHLLIEGQPDQATRRRFTFTLDSDRDFCWDKFR